MKTALKNYLLKEQTNASNANKQEEEDSESEDEDNKEKTNEIATSIEIEKSIMPSLANFMEKLDYELLKAYQNTQHTKIEYLQRLRDENKFLFLCDQVQNFLVEQGDASKASRVAILKLDHLYYKNDSIYEKINSNVQVNDENRPYTLTNSQQ